MKRDRPLFKKKQSNSLFAVGIILPQIIIIALVVGIYYYITSKGFFPQWTHYIYYTAKYFIALEIVIAGVKSLVGPILAMGIGAFNLFLIQVHSTGFLSADDSWQLIFIGVIAFVVTFVVRSLTKD